MYVSIYGSGSLGMQVRNLAERNGWQVLAFIDDNPDLKNIDINPKTFVLRAQSQNIKDQLRSKTNDAYKKGIFGAPTFIVNGKIFWGQDRLDYAIDEYNS